jgi:hypothetical protein
MNAIYVHVDIHMIKWFNTLFMICHMNNIIYMAAVSTSSSVWKTSSGEWLNFMNFTINRLQAN